jgi:DoxX-like protein
VKSLRISYWIVTVAAAGFMALATVPDVMQAPEAQSIIKHLGYPIYLLPFLGTAKALAIAVMLVPGLRRLKEWAFAGLTFDLSGALYSHLSVGDGPGSWMPAVIGILLVGSSYLLHRRYLTALGRRENDAVALDRHSRAA